jgi:hypothetical protein
MITPSRQVARWSPRRFALFVAVILPVVAVVVGVGAGCVFTSDSGFEWRFVGAWQFWVSVPLPILAGQVLLLSGAPAWKPDHWRGRGPILLSVMAFGLIAAALSAGLLGTLSSLASLLSSEGRIEPMIDGQTLLLTGLFLWLPWMIVFALVTSSPWDSLFGRLYRMLVVGTVLEIATTIPVDVFVRRRSRCYCEEGTAIALLLGLSAAGILFGPGVVLLALRRRNQWRLREHICLGCGYDLRHLPEPRCPECGRPFQPRPASPKTDSTVEQTT